MLIPSGGTWGAGNRNRESVTQTGGESMDEILEKKESIREEIRNRVNALSKEERLTMIEEIEARLFGFANFLESKVVLLYKEKDPEVPTARIIKECYPLQKVVVLPAFKGEKKKVEFFKVDTPDALLKTGPRGVPEPDRSRCKPVPVDFIDIALIPGIAFDEKGGRIGTGDGYYDRLIPKLSITTRKVALTREAQMVPQVPMEPHDRFVDIIITEKRIIYKI